MTRTNREVYHIFCPEAPRRHFRFQRNDQPRLADWKKESGERDKERDNKKEHEHNERKNTRNREREREKAREREREHDIEDRERERGIEKENKRAR